nr:VaFE repeat-containing surface-anchored protein [Bifidobacterium animalis]
MRKHNGVRLDGGHSALAVLARRAASACMAVATVVGVVEAAPAWAEESAEFPQTMHFAVSMANMNLSENDLPAFRYGFSGFREANPTVPVYTNSQFEEAQAYFRGNAAYCMDVDKGAPGDHWGDARNTVTVAEPVTGYHMFKYTTRPSTVEYHKAGAPQTGAVAWIAAKGYPNVESQSVFAKNLDDVDARSVTQLAIWIASGQVRVEGGEDSSKATKAVSVANPGHQVAGAGYSSGGQQNFAPYTMIGLAWLLAQKALNAEDRDEYEAVFYEPVGTAGTLQRMLYARRVPKKAHPRTVTMRKVATNAAYTTANEAYDMTGAEYALRRNGTLVHTFSTDAEGRATSSVDVMPGTYTLQEMQAPRRGYTLNSKVKTVEIAEGSGTQTITMDGEHAELPLTSIDDLHVRKVIANAGSPGSLEGDVASLEGVRFRVEWFGMVATDAAALEGKHPQANAIWRTDSDGVARLHEKPDEGTWPYTDSAGRTMFPLGTVRITELNAPQGLVRAASAQHPGSVFTLTDGGDHKVMRTTLNPWNNGSGGNDATTIAFPNETVKGGVEVVKTDDDLHGSQPQGDASLDGTVYEIVNKSMAPVHVGGREIPRDAVVATIATKTVQGNSVAATETRLLPYGTYQIRERSAAAGYHRAGFDKTFRIREDNMIVRYTLDANGVDANMATIRGVGANANDVQRGGLQLLKVDRETGLATPLGAASLNGTGFEVINRSANAVVVNNRTYKSGDVVRTLSASYGDIVDSDGKPTGRKGIVARTAIDELPYGTYEVRETVASAGYLRDASARAWSKRFTIGHDGGDASTGAYEANGNPHRYASLAHVSGAGSASNQVQRSDFHFIKKSADTMERMGPIAWRLTSKTTGESHVIVSDKNGELHTKSCDGRFNDSGTGTTGCRPHSRNTNANDPDAVNANGAVGKDSQGNPVVKDASKLDAEAGIWFTGIGPRSGGQSVQWTSATSYEVTRDGAKRAVQVNDALRALPYDDYELVELPTPGANDGHRMLSVTLTAKEFSRNGDGSLNPDGNGVDMDYGTLGNVAMGMTTRLAYFGAGADAFGDDGNAGDKLAPAIGTLSVVDSAEYWGVTAGTYTDSGELYVIENGRISGEAVAKATKQLKVGNPHGGTSKLTFTIDHAERLAGKTVVAFRTIRNADGTSLLEHRDAADAEQQLRFPQIHTNAAADIDDEANASAQSVTITDAVSYANLVAGKPYTLKATLHYRTFGDTGVVSDGGVVHDRHGKEVTAELPFAPSQSDGTVDVTFLFEPPEDLAGKTVVAFESLQHNGVDFAAHADIADERQDVRFPAIATSASDAFDGDSLLPITNGVVKDVVEYRNLSPGHEYELVSTIHAKVVGDDGTVSDMGALTDGDGNTLTVTTTFTPGQADGTVDVEFPLDVGHLRLEGKRCVMFETLLRDHTMLAEHADINDEHQEVQIASIGTQLTTEGGAHELQVTSAVSQAQLDAQLGIQVRESDDDVSQVEVVLTDTVAYANLLADMPYRMDGELHLRGFDNAGHARDAGVLKDHAGNTVVASVEFTPKRSNGTAKLEFRFTVLKRDLHNVVLVAYERLYSNPMQDAQQLTAEHADIADEGQTVRIIDIGTQARDARSGTHSGTLDSRISQVDTVAFTGLTVGKEYEVRGELHIRDANGEDGGVLRNKDGQPVTAFARFTAAKPTGTAELRFDAELGNVSGEVQTVAFERLMVEGKQVAMHADIDDAGQTVIYPKPPEPQRPRDNAGSGTSVAATGVIADVFLAFAVITGALGLMVLTGLLIARRNRNL